MFSLYYIKHTKYVITIWTKFSHQGRFEWLEGNMNCCALLLCRIFQKPPKKELIGRLWVESNTHLRFPHSTTLDSLEHALLNTFVSFIRLETFFSSLIESEAGKGNLWFNFIPLYWKFSSEVSGFVFKVSDNNFLPHSVSQTRANRKLTIKS